MSILTGRRGGNTGEKLPPAPTMPAPQQPRTMADPQSLFPAAKAIQELWDERNKLEQKVIDLTNDLVLGRMRQQDLESLLDQESKRSAAIDRLKDRYLRFAQEILTRGEDVGTRLADLRGRFDDITRNQALKMIDEVRGQLAKILTRAMEAAQSDAPQVDQEMQSLISDAQKVQDQEAIAQDAATGE